MFSITPKIRANFKGIQNSAQSAALLVHSKPILAFFLPATIYVNERDEVVDMNAAGARPETVMVEYHFRIDPKKIRPELNNYIAAVRDRLSGAQRMVEKVAAASGAIAAKKMTRNDLPDASILADVYAEMDEAMDARLLACVDVEGETGLTAWNYTDANGNHIQLTGDLLKKDVRLAEAMQAAFQEWYSPTKPSSGEATKATTDDGTTGSAQQQAAN